MQEKRPRPEHPDLSTTLNNLATLYTDQHQYAKAEPLYQRALAILERVWRSEHLDMVLILTNYSAPLTRRIVPQKLTNSKFAPRPFGASANQLTL